MRAHVLNAFFSLVFAAMILSAVGSHLTTQVTLKVAIEVSVPTDVIVSYRGSPSVRGRLLLEEGDAPTVTLSGTKEKVEAIKQAGLRVIWSPKPGELSEALSKGRFELRSESVVASTLPSKVIVVEAKPASLELRFSRVVERSVWVEPGPLVGKPADGFRIPEKGIRLNVNQVRVRGESRTLESDPGTPERPYPTEPIDLSNRPRQTFTVKRKVLPRPDGVTPLEEVEVTVVIEEELAEKDVEFPVHYVQEARSNDAQLQHLPFRVKADGGRWSRKLRVRGPKLALQALEATLERQRRGPVIVPVNEPIPFAYISDIPIREIQDVVNAKAKIRLSGLPAGVELIEEDLDFRVVLVPIK